MRTRKTQGDQPRQPGRLRSLLFPPREEQEDLSYRGSALGRLMAYLKPHRRVLLW